MLFSALLATYSCTQNTSLQDSETSLDQARKSISQNDFKKTFQHLSRAFQKKEIKAMSIVQDSAFQKLIDHPDLRPEIRSLIQKHSYEYSCKMTRISEPGEVINVRIKIIDEVSKKPIEGVSAEFVHTDINGLYFAEQSLWNPRIFAYLKSNEQGEFQIETIMPGRYTGEENVEGPSHIHFSLDKKGYRNFSSEFSFNNDPVLLNSGNPEKLPVADLLHIENKEEYIVTLALQPIEEN